jgi:hypothetical protein
VDDALQKESGPASGAAGYYRNYPMNDCAVLLVPATVRIPQKMFSESKIICAAWCWSRSAAPVQKFWQEQCSRKIVP